MSRIRPPHSAVYLGPVPAALGSDRNSLRGGTTELSTPGLGRCGAAPPGADEHRTVGDTLDTAVAESFSASLQCELLDRHYWHTRAELARAMFHYVETFYDPTRRHSTLGHLGPIDYGAAHAA